MVGMLTSIFGKRGRLDANALRFLCVESVFFLGGADISRLQSDKGVGSARRPNGRCIEFTRSAFRVGNCSLRDAS